ncbi:Pre-rRNA-processing protein IPI3 [Scheffersomyces xylosifermentans]|uniref:Pre-rRNA-processing protein IPI3 n=1 Tax=Scheffersomyces xylosifermentans TaxID=1304137 RepID=UPI00315DD8DC
MDESIFYIAEGDPADKHSQESFAMATSVHNSHQHASFRQADCAKNGAVLTGSGPGERLLVASPNKALLNVYSWGKESPDQRIPLPEALTCLSLVSHPNSKLFVDSMRSSQFNLPSFRIPWLLAGGSKSGKIYVWELSSGSLLCVKEAHYQAISVVRFSKCGTFLVAGSDDARCTIWKTLDLISIFQGEDEDTVKAAKPFHAITDNTLAISDLYLSEAGLINDLRLYTVSKDSTLRIYDIMTKSLLTTFILPEAIDSVVTDPAGRAVYLGLASGLIRTIPLYNINPNTMVLESIGGNRKIVTVENDPNLNFTFVHHQQRLSAETNTSLLHKSLKKKNDDDNKPISVTKLAISLDGTNLVSGDSLGRVFVSDIITRQVAKTFTPCNSPISYIQVNAAPFDALNTPSSSKVDKKHRLIPQFKRVLASRNPIEHQLNLEIPSEAKDEEEEDFGDWLSRKTQEDLEFKNLSGVNSSVKTVSTSAISSSNQELEEKLAKVSNAYTELRTKHEELLKEHSKVLSSK